MWGRWGRWCREQGCCSPCRCVSPPWPGARSQAPLSPGQGLLFKARCLSFSFFYPKSDILANVTGSWKLCYLSQPHVPCACTATAPQAGWGPAPSTVAVQCPLCRIWVYRPRNEHHCHGNAVLIPGVSSPRCKGVLSKLQAETWDLYQERRQKSPQVCSPTYQRPDEREDPCGLKCMICY